MKKSTLLWPASTSKAEAVSSLRNSGLPFLSQAGQSPDQTRSWQRASNTWAWGSRILGCLFKWTKHFFLPRTCNTKWDYSSVRVNCLFLSHQYLRWGLNILQRKSHLISIFLVLWSLKFFTLLSSWLPRFLTPQPFSLNPFRLNSDLRF